jgi:capsular exopolysaccharide synthesis family protein
MSEFFKALGQADRDRALREQAKARQQSVEPDAARPAEPAAEEKPPVIMEPPRPVEASAPEVASAVVDDVSGDVSADVEEERESPFVRKSRLLLPRPRASKLLDPEQDGLDGHFVSLVTPATFEAEQYRALRHTIEEVHKASGLAVVAVSSPSVGDGKTTTAINLAGALAQSPESRVLLIDADLRRPSVARSLGLQTAPSPGFVGMLLDRNMPLAHTVRQRAPYTLDILPAGDPPAAPYELLRSARLSEVMAEARKRYDYIVLDTPPLVGLPDCRVLANFVDGFVVVVAAHRTPKRLVQDALEVVEPAKMIGLVFNMDERPMSGYYREYGAPTNGHRHRKWRWSRG